MFNNLKLKTMESIKNRFLSTVLLLALITGGCTKDDTGTPKADTFNGTVTAKVENGASYNAEIGTVFALFNATINSVTGQLTGQTLGNGNYANGGFTINLSGIPTSNLMNIQTFFTNYLEISGALEYSDSDARLLDVDFYAILNDGNYLDYFIYLKTGSKPTICLFVFADRDVTITGGKNVSVALQSGWNRIYITPADKKVTSKAPSGMKWYLNSDV